MKQSTRVVLAKATPSKTDDKASFTGYASVFDVIDSYGDVVRKGAFSKSIEALSADGAQPLGVYYAHNMNSSPYGLVGVVTSIAEDDHGLKVVADLFVDSNPEARFLHEAMQLGVINEMSFAYYVTDSDWAKVDGEEVYEIKGVDLLEVSVCPVGANRQALVQEVKSRVSHRKTESDAVTVEDEATETTEPTDDTEDEPTTPGLHREVIDSVNEAAGRLADIIAPLVEALDTPDEAAAEAADTGSEAAAEDTQKTLALRARAALAMARSRAGKVN